jgi:hypothetical protein
MASDAVYELLPRRDTVWHFDFEHGQRRELARTPSVGVDGSSEHVEHANLPAHSVDMD